MKIFETSSVRNRLIYQTRVDADNVRTAVLISKKLRKFLQRLLRLMLLHNVGLTVYISP